MRIYKNLLSGSEISLLIFMSELKIQIIKEQKVEIRILS